MNCIIVDDEIMARKSLEKLCEKTEQLKLLGSCENAKKALGIIEKNDLDLIFLDIEMPDMSGLELLNVMPYLPQIIFTTSNKEYAFEAFEYDVTDFLKKPIIHSRFLKAVEKAENRQNQLDTIARISAESEIYIKSKGRLVRVEYEDILFFENIGDYIKLVTQKENFVFHGTIKSLNTKIDHPRFLKVHRSFIVSLDKIKDIEENSLVIGKSVIPISRAHKSLLLQSINIL